VSATNLEVFCIEKAGSEIAAGFCRGCGPYLPSACLSPKRTYAADTPSSVARILSGRSTMVPSAARDVLGLEKRWP
jgi:hypothetical protein